MPLCTPIGEKGRTWRTNKTYGISLSAGLEPEAALQAMDAERYLRRVDAIREEATQIGVTGIPALVIGRYGVVGCQPYDAIT